MEKRIIKRVGIFSVAKLQGMVGLIFGLIIGIIYAIAVLIMGIFAGAIFSQADDSGVGAIGSVGFGIIGAIIAVIAFPLIYGVISFIAGAIAGAIYNGASKLAGGIEIELENAEPMYAAPPQPQWGGQPQQARY